MGAKQFGFGIVGCGMIATFHARAIAEMKDAKLIGCFDSDRAAAVRLATEHHGQVYSQLSDLLADHRIQVVTICTPSGAHLEPALAAAGAGKHLIVEKPLEVNLKRCDRIIAACTKHGVTLSTIFPARFNSSSQRLKQAIDQGRFGTLTMADAYVKWFRTQEYYDSGSWRGTWKLDGGGALMNQAIHSVDLLVWLVGPVVEVTARTATLAHLRIEVEDVVTAILSFENGALGVIEATTAAYPGWQKRIEVHGTQGSVRLEDDHLQLWQFDKMNRRDRQIAANGQLANPAAAGAYDPSSISYNGHLAQFKNVLTAIRAGKSPLIDGPEGRRSVEIVRAIYQSAATNKSVKLPLN